jgi:hypothetical protein
MLADNAREDFFDETEKDVKGELNSEVLEGSA